jgi:hypothetical protein
VRSRPGAARTIHLFHIISARPLNRLVWWEVPLGYIALRSFLFLQEHHHHQQKKDVVRLWSSHAVYVDAVLAVPVGRCKFKSARMDAQPEKPW